MIINFSIIDIDFIECIDNYFSYGFLNGKMNEVENTIMTKKVSYYMKSSGPSAEPSARPSADLSAGPFAEPSNN